MSKTGTKDENIEPAALLHDRPRTLKESMAEPLSEPLASVFAEIRRFVACKPWQAAIVSLYVAHTYVIRSLPARYTPYLYITAPTPESGKTVLLEVVDQMVVGKTHQQLTPPALREESGKGGVVLLDECDQWLQGRNELISLLNSGYEKETTASLMQAEADGQAVNYVTKTRDLFSSKVLAGIGEFLPPTTASRSLRINLLRAGADSSIQRFTAEARDDLRTRMRPMLQAWANGLSDLDKIARPLQPDFLSNRYFDCAEPLLMVADQVGGEWPALALNALAELYGKRGMGEEVLGIELLRDIRDVWEPSGARLSSEELTSKLILDTSLRWATFENSRPLTPNKLANMLRPFDIGSRPIRIESAIRRGYSRADFETVWARYLRSGDEDVAV